MGDVYTNPPQSRNEAILEATITDTQYTAPPQSRIEDLLLQLKEVIEEGGGGGGTSNYNSLSNKPQINSTTLSGNKTTEDLIPIAGGLEIDDEGKLKASIGDGLKNNASGETEVSIGDGLSLNNDGEIEADVKESDIDADPVSKTGNPITITDAANIPCESLVMTIEPTQSGSGTPSPTNIRPFVGKTDATAQTTNGTDTNTAMVTFGQTLYNAIIDFTKGTATLLWKVGKVQYLAKNTGNYFYSDNVVGGSNDVTIVCDRVNTKSTPDYNSETGAFLNVYGVFSIVTPESYSTCEEALAAYGGEINVLYELPTPEIIQLTPTQLTLLKGNNTVSGDGVTITLDYQKDNVVGDIKKWVLEQISALS